MTTTLQPDPGTIATMPVPHESVVFVDCEFIDCGERIWPISLGACTLSGDEFYVEWADVPWALASDWVHDNVRPHLTGDVLARPQIASSFQMFAGPCPTFWADSPAYDWVMISQMFGTMNDRPTGWPYNCRDLRQWSEQIGLDAGSWPPHRGDEHHALADARHHRDIWLLLSRLSSS